MEPGITASNLSVTASMLNGRQKKAISTFFNFSVNAFMRREGPTDFSGWAESLGFFVPFDVPMRQYPSVGPADRLIISKGARACEEASK